MDLIDLVRAAIQGETLAVRQWAADADSAQIRWSTIAEPIGLSRMESVVAAALVGLLAERAHETAPKWVEATPPAEEPIWLDKRALKMANTRREIEATCPAPLRNKHVFASNQYMTVR